MAKEGTPCYENLWDAVESVRGAKLWQTSLRNSGLSNILKKNVGPGDTSNVVFVVKDSGLLPCDTENLFTGNEIPELDCAANFRARISELNDDGEAPLLMYHWLSDQTKGSLDSGETYSTLLEQAAQKEDGSFDSHSMTRITFLNNNTITLPESVAPDEGVFGGYQNATIIDERILCDASGGIVYVLDRPLKPVGLPNTNTASLAQLDNFCTKSMYSILKENNAPKVSAQTSLGSYLYPLLETITDPRTNLTFFFPTVQQTPSVDQTITNVYDREAYIATYVLMMLLDGGKCPDDFKDGVTIRTLFGDKAGIDVSMRIEPDDDNQNEFAVNLMLGNETGSAVYKAIYLGNACYSTVYKLETLIIPYSNVDSNRVQSRIPAEILNQIPQVSLNDSFNVGDICSDGYKASISGAENAETSSIHGGALAGIIVGACASVALITVCIWWLYRKYMGKRASGIEPCVKMSGSQVLSDDETCANQSGLLLKESDLTFDVDPESGELVELGRGRFGRVYQGCLHGVDRVAIKCITDETAFSFLHIPSTNTSSRKSSSSRIEFEDATPENSNSEQGDAQVLRDTHPISSKDQIYKEVSVLKSCQSQHIVSFMGAVLLPKEVRLITELMPAGDLWTALGHGATSRKVTWYHGGIFIAMDVAAGLDYLHEKRRVIHLDLKSSNILLRDAERKAGRRGYDGMYQAKISDVGLSKILPMSCEYLSSLQAGGTWNWCAPEVILNYKCTSAADMYSYGVVLWEICTGEAPIRGCMRDVRVPEECPQEISDLIHACIDWNEHFPVRDRPKASKAYAIIESLLQ